MQKLTAVASLVLAAFLVTSCGDTGARMTATAPTAVTTTDSPSFTLASSSVSGRSASAATTFSFCPFGAPLTVGLFLGVTAGSVSLTVVQLGVQFVDTSGISTPQITLPAPVPTTQFGTALVQARQTGIFPLNVGLGCGTGVRGTVVVVVIARDQFGRPLTGQTSMMLR